MEEVFLVPILDLFLLCWKMLNYLLTKDFT